jgi:predicted acetyltransferase
MLTYDWRCFFLKRNFEFLPFDFIKGEEIDLLIERKVPGNKAMGYFPAYWYAINLSGTSLTIGTIDLRIGSNAHTYYGGHIGYAIDKKYRGNKYAMKACKLLKQVALAHDLNELIITCNPENIASNKTCKRLGASFIEIVDLPTNNEMYLEGERKKCIYKWRIS